MHKLVKFVLFFIIISSLLVGCDKQTIDSREQLPRIINQTIELTDKTIQTRDIKTAREIWSQVSEYGLKAKELGNDELADILGQLASSYRYLVDYLQSGNEDQLKRFRLEFNSNIKKMKQYASGKTKI